MENGLLTFISGGSLVAFFLIEVIKKSIKKWIVPRWGDLGVQLSLLVISVALALIYFVWQNLIPQSIVVIAGSIFSGAILIYQVLWKAVIQKGLLNHLDKGEEKE